MTVVFMITAASSLVYMTGWFIAAQIRGRNYIAGGSDATGKSYHAKNQRDTPSGLVMQSEQTSLVTAPKYRSLTIGFPYWNIRRIVSGVDRAIVSDKPKTDPVLT